MLGRKELRYVSGAGLAARSPAAAFSSSRHHLSSASIASPGTGCCCAKDWGGGLKRGTAGSVKGFLGQVPTELENEAPAPRGQEAKRASEGTGHQVRRELNQGRCRLGVGGEVSENVSTLLGPCGQSQLRRGRGGGR